MRDGEPLYQPVPESYSKLFRRFLGFGLLAWGGPVAQISMIRQELVEEEHWLDREHFNRVLAVYQVLPGPEATELCVYFGLLARGRLGGIIAGLAFILPGFLLMLALSWLYVTFGVASPLFAAVSYGVQPAVAALVVRALVRIGQHALTNRWLWAIAILAAVAERINVHFLVTLGFAGTIALLYQQRRYRLTAILGVLALIGLLVALQLPSFRTSGAAASMPSPVAAQPSLPTLLWSGLRSGALTFGGAYTVIPFLQSDAVEVGGWMSERQFLDGLALSGIIPGPLIIFATFVGYLGGGPIGAIILTFGIFLPAFAFTLVGHSVLEKLIANKSLHAFLDGVTAGVVGLIAATSLDIMRVAVVDVPALLIFAGALLAYFSWSAKSAVFVIMVTAGLIGLAVY
jgi:chromate transporter